MAPLILSPRQRSESDYLVCHTPVAKERCRAQALLWLDEGETAEQGAETLHVSRRAVYYWVERFQGRSGLDLIHNPVEGVYSEGGRFRPDFGSPR